MKIHPAAIGIIAIIFIALAVTLRQTRTGNPGNCRDLSSGNLTIGHTQFSVGLAESSADQAQGLAGCQEIPKNSGLYFPYDPPRQVSFWMRGMHIPIDIIWIGEGSAVIGIEENVQPASDPTSTNLPTFTPPAPVSGVLEIKAGGAEQHGIQIGDKVEITS